MKFLVISAFIGITTVGLCNAAAIPANDMAFPAGGPIANVVKRDCPTVRCMEGYHGELDTQLDQCTCVPNAPPASLEEGVKQDASTEPLVLPPPGPVINGTSLECASWWKVINLAAQPDPCLAALVTAQNITFAQFRTLNPDVNSTCTNLEVGYAYCIQGVSSAFPDTTGLLNGSTASNASARPPPSSAPAPLPALRVTMARTGTRRPGQPAPTAVSQARSEASSVTIMRNVTADVQSSFSILEATGKPNTATIGLGGRPFFTATFLDGWTGDTSIVASPLNLPTDAAQFPNQSATPPFITSFLPRPIPLSSAGLRSAADGAHVGVMAYNTTLGQQSKAESCHEAPDGQIQCSKEKRQLLTCHEAPDGQVQCSKEKRDTTQVDPKYGVVDVYKGHKKCHKEQVPQDPGKFCQFPPCYDEKEVCERDAMPGKYTPPLGLSVFHTEMVVK
ncbi:MAG: hypothetical protein Q9184_003516 [Pyrenodesmia sp. 2 TL-2023]